MSLLRRLVQHSSLLSRHSLSSSVTKSSLVGLRHPPTPPLLVKAQCFSSQSNQTLSPLLRQLSFRTKTARSHLSQSPSNQLVFTKRSYVSTTVPATPPGTSRVVGFWLLGCSALVFTIIVVGGITRLTESGLSITEWKPVTGVWWPTSEEEWMQEFTKYKQSPEFKMLNSSIDLENFKRIYYMEWLHRILGRVLGITFVLPAVNFAARGKLARKDIWRVGGLSLLIGFQGFLGWYMVKSGLDEQLAQIPGAVPRVSQYRLAAHLGAAFTLYTGMFTMALRILRDHKFASGTLDVKAFTHSSALAPFRRYAGLVTGLVFVTALSGAFVAGLDAGLIYNEFPYMGESIVPPVNELLSSDYAKSATSDSQYWRNVFENPTTVQFDHRLLATVTYVAVSSLALASLHPTARRILPTSTKRLLMGALAAVNAQVALGISTLLMLVPVHLAATHQAGSVVLLTTLLAVVTSLRKPSQIAQLARRIPSESQALRASLHKKIPVPQHIPAAVQPSS